MAARFPLFRFPPNVAETLLKDLKLVDLFELSQLSKKAFNLVRNTALLHRTYFHIRLTSSSCITLFRGRDDLVQFSFYGNRDHERYDLDNHEHRIVEVNTETSYHLIFARRSLNSYGCASNSIEDVLQFIKYISELFNATNEHLVVDHSQIPHIKAIQSLSLLRKSKTVVITNGTVSHRVMRRILGGFECDKMKIVCSPEPNFHYDFQIAIRDLQVFGGQWFKSHMLFNLDCQYLYIDGCVLTDEHVNTLIDQWAQDTDIKIPEAMFLSKLSTSCEVLDIYGDNVTNQNQWDLDQITEDLFCTEQPLLSRQAIINSIVHREVDDWKIYIVNINHNLIVQSDFDPVDDSTCSLAHFFPSFLQRTFPRE